MENKTIDVTKELVVLKKQVSNLENQANSIVIGSKDDYTKAIDIVAKLKDAGSTIKNKKESITKPLNEALRNARSLFAPIEDQYECAEKIIKGKLLEYKRKIDEEARIEENKIAAKLEKGTIKTETAERKIEAIDRIDSTTRGKVGEIQVRKIKKVRVIDESAIPRNYLVPDMVAIRRDALGGTMIPGVEVYEEESIAAGSI